MIKLLIGGSPCTFWSICRAGTESEITRETKNEGIGWELFSNYEIAKRKFKPDFFIYENVASMHKNIKESVSCHLGCDPHMIDGGLVSAAVRERYFWTDILVNELPKDRGLVLGDILEDVVDEKYYYNCEYDFHGLDKPVCATLHINDNDIIKRVNNPKFKCPTLTAVCGGNHQKKVFVGNKCRKLTPVEYERCMTLPDGYTAAVSDTHRYKGLGNGFTAEVIIHNLNGALKDVPKDEEIIVLSMYDGIGTGRYCLDKMGFTNVKYFAYEIDTYAKKIAMSNYPDIIQMGDAFDLRHPDWTIGY
jgi:DNA (cytosine-5)-methyltransferase 3A